MGSIDIVNILNLNAFILQKEIHTPIHTLKKSLIFSRHSASLSLKQLLILPQHKVYWAADPRRQPL